MSVAGVVTGLGIAAVAAAGIGVYNPRSGLFGPVIARGPRTRRTLYLTFDDGPNPTATERILSVLAESRTPAAFFLLGEHVRLYPDLSREVAAAGHEIGNHTQTHRKLPYRGPAYIEGEMRHAHDAIGAAVGVVPRTFRAPHGLRNPFVHVAARRMGYEVVAWTFGVRDHEQPGPEEIRRRVRVRLRPGAIILLHDGDGYDPRGERAHTAAALPGILEDAREAGYEFRPLADLLGAP